MKVKICVATAGICLVIAGIVLAIIGNKRRCASSCCSDVDWIDEE